MNKQPPGPGEAVDAATRRRAGSDPSDAPRFHREEPPAVVAVEAEPRVGEESIAVTYGQGRLIYKFVNA